MTTPIHSIDPVVREDVVDLAKLVSFGIGPQAWVTFQHSVVWLRSVTASISYHHGGKLLKRGGTYGDHGGYLTALPIAIAYAEEACEVFGVSKTSTLVISISLEIVDRPMLRVDPAPYGMKGKTYYVEPGSQDGHWFFADESAMKAYAEAATGETRQSAFEQMRKLKPTPVLMNKSVWSSDLNLGRNNSSAVFQFIHDERNRAGVLALTATTQ